MIFGTGLLVGTAAPGAVRLNIDSKNSLTDEIGSSNVGGNFVLELRASGFSHLVTKGASENLAYLWIEDQKIELRDATTLENKTIPETDAQIKSELGEDIQILTIGPAGEHQARSACIMVNQARAAGHCGLGAIMGSSVQLADSSNFRSPRVGLRDLPLERI